MLKTYLPSDDVFWAQYQLKLKELDETMIRREKQRAESRRLRKERSHNQNNVQGSAQSLPPAA